MLDKKFEIGDLVWAQMRRYPPWPAQIVEPPVDEAKKGQHYVFFFGSDNYSWISDDYINHHSESLIPKQKKKNASLQKAIDKIIELSKIKPTKKNSHLNGDSDPSNNQQEPCNSVDNPIVKSKRKRHLSGESESSVSEVHLKKDSHLSIVGEASNIQQEFKNCVDNPTGKSTRKRHLLDESEMIVVEVPLKENSHLSVDGETSKSHKELNLDCVDNSKIKSKKKCHLSNKSKKSVLKNVPNSGIPSTSYADITALKDAENASRSPSECDIKLNESQLLQEPVDKRNLQCVKPTPKIGFIGAGAMGQHIVKSLLLSGHEVTIYNRTPEKCNDSVKAGALRAETPADVVKASDIIFSCVSDACAAKSLLLAKDGILKGLEDSGAGNVYKGYVELTSLDSVSSEEIAECIACKGGKYIEASMIGTRQNAENGSLVLLVSGDETLYQDCSTCFRAISSRVFFIKGEIGSSSKLRIVMSMFLGTSYAAMAETLALVKRSNLNQQDFIELLKLKGFDSSDIIKKGMNILDCNYDNVTTPLKYQQKELNLALHLSDITSQPMRVAAATNELYKYSRFLGHADKDVSAVYEGAKYDCSTEAGVENFHLL